MVGTIKVKNITIVYCFRTQVGFDKEANQDFVSVCNDNDGFSIVVCDGLGSAKLSAQGAQTAALLLSNMILSKEFRKDDFANKWKASFPSHPEQYNTTAKFVLIRDGQVRFGGVGDGLIAIKTNGSIFEQVDHGAFSNQTSCIADPLFSSGFKDQNMAYSDSMVGLISSDGFSEDIEDGGIGGLLQQAEGSLSDEKKSQEFDEELGRLLADWPNKTNGDDKTVAFVLARRND